MLDRPAGFTLIELMVAISIMGVLLSLSIAGFIQFQDNQKVLAAAKEVQQLFVNGQVKARVKETPSGCSGSLSGYKLTRSGNTFTLAAACSSDIVRDSVSVPNVTIWGNFGDGDSILFATQYQSSVSPKDLCFSSGTHYYGFSVAAAGQISDVEQGAGACP